MAILPHLFGLINHGKGGGGGFRVGFIRSASDSVGGEGGAIGAAQNSDVRLFDRSGGTFGGGNGGGEDK